MQRLDSYTLWAFNPQPPYAVVRRPDETDSGQRVA